MGLPPGKPGPGRPKGLQNRTTRTFKEGLERAYQALGAEQFFIELGRGSAEDKRCLAQIMARRIPLAVEVRGEIDTSLVVRVVTQVGEVHRVRLDPPSDGRSLIGESKRITPIAASIADETEVSE